jgi:hypothetical protein
MLLGLLLMQHQAVVAKPLLRAVLKWLPVVALAQPAALKSLLLVVASAQPAALKSRLAILVQQLHRAMVADSD